MGLKKKFIDNDQIDQNKILLDNNSAFRQKNSGGTPVDLWKLDDSDILQLLQLPRVASDASNANDIVRKSQMDTADALKEDAANKDAANGYCGLDSSSEVPMARLKGGQANGVATLDAGSKVPSSQLPDSIVGSLQYQGVWNASTNSPSIPAAASGNKGNYYKVSVAGSTNVDGETDWKVGDMIVSNGTAWDKIDNTESVTSVAGKSGAVTLDSDDVSEAANLYHTAQRARDALTFSKEAITLDSTDITNQYVDLATEAKANSVHIFCKGGTYGAEDLHYTLSVVSTKTRVTFAGDWATSGSAELVANDVLYVKYMNKDS